MTCPFVISRRTRMFLTLILSSKRNLPQHTSHRMAGGGAIRSRTAISEGDEQRRYVKQRTSPSLEPIAEIRCPWWTPSSQLWSCTDCVNSTMVELNHNSWFTTRQKTSTCLRPQISSPSLSQTIKKDLPSTENGENLKCRKLRIFPSRWQKNS